MATGALTAQTSHSDASTGAVPWPASASVAHLKVKGIDNGGKLRRQQQHHGAEHAQFQIGAVGRPDVGPQVDDRREQRTAIRGACGSLSDVLVVVVVTH